MRSELEENYFTDLLMTKKSFEHDPKWAKAKKLCRLNMEDIRMAKELGIGPKSLMKNIPGPSQQWKLPVKLWIRELHEERFGRRNHTDPASKPNVNSVDVPF